MAIPKRLTRFYIITEVHNEALRSMKDEYGNQRRVLRGRMDDQTDYKDFVI